MPAFPGWSLSRIENVRDEYGYKAVAYSSSNLSIAERENVRM
jgi:hypothetical protein